MTTTAITCTLPAGVRVRIGVPAESPSFAISALQKHFSGRPAVRSARLGLMEVHAGEPESFFTYTIGIDCHRYQDVACERDLALEVLQGMPGGRWPISFLESTADNFTAEAIVFYRAPPKKGFLLRLFGAAGWR